MGKTCDCPERERLLAPVGILRRLSYTVPKHLLRSVYFSLIHCRLQYLTALWYPTKGILIHPIEVLQNKAIKNLYGLPLRYSTRNLYSNFNIMPLASIYKYQVTVYIHQVIKSNRHSNINFCIRSSIHSYGTRQISNINLTRVSSERAKNCILFRGVQLHNSIPLNVGSLGVGKCILHAKKNFGPRNSS